MTKIFYVMEVYILVVKNEGGGGIKVLHGRI